MKRNIVHMSKAGILRTILVTVHGLGLLISALPLQAQGQKPFRFTVTPKSPSPIVVTTIPEASCIIHAKNATHPEQSLKLFADERGVLRFSAVTSAESEQLAELQIDCHGANQSATFPLQLHSSFSPTVDMPAPSSEAPKPSEAPYVRPALTQTEALQLAPSALAARGYPPRPDQEESPKGFSTWMRAVTQPATYIPSKLVNHPERTHVRQRISDGIERSNNWSGYELRSPAGSYVGVQGMWTVPTVTAEVNTQTYSSFWVGLDGDIGTNDLVQAGTAQDITNIDVGFLNVNLTNYYAWTQFLPQQDTERGLSIPIAPGDEISCSVFMANLLFGVPFPSLSGAYAVFSLENVTKGQYSVAFTAKGNTTFVGSEAEWIMERPTVNGQTPDLANYGIAFMWNASALSPKTNSWVNYSAAPNEQILMYNGSDLLSLPNFLTSSEMYFLFVNNH